jgi:serine/threonine protein kinase
LAAESHWLSCAAELLRIVSDTGEAEVRDPGAAGALVAHESFDIWAFGVLLYLLLTGQQLFNNDQQDNLDADDLLKLAMWDQKQLKAALRKVHTSRRPNPLAKELLEKLLQPKPDDRPDDFGEVLDHPFFTGESDGSDLASKVIIERMEEMHQETMQAHQKTQVLLNAIVERTINIETTSEKTLVQLCKTERVLLRGMFEATEVKIPTSFIIMPNKIEPSEGDDPSTGSFIELDENGEGIKLSAAGENMREEFERRKGWFDQMCVLGSSIADG